MNSPVRQPELSGGVEDVGEFQASPKSRIAKTETGLFAIILLCVFVLARYMQWGQRVDILASIRIELLLALALSVVCGMQQGRIQFNQARTQPVILATAALLLAIVLQIPFAVDGATAWTIFFDRVFKMAFLTYFMAVLIQSPRNMRWFIGAFLLACFYVTQEATRGQLDGSLVWENQGVMRLHGAVPLYRHPNSLAGIAMGTIPYIVFLWAHLQNWVQRGFVVLLLVTSFACVLYSGSRTGYVAFFSLAVYWFVVSRRKGRWILIASLVGLVGFALIPPEYEGRFASITAKEEGMTSKNMRIEILEDALTIFVENPFGVGVGCFPAARNKRFGRQQDTHNLYLEVATNLGVQGLVVFGIFIWQILLILRRTRTDIQTQMKILMQLRGRLHVPGHRRLARRQVRDLRFLDALAVATAGFIWVRLSLGLFGMDLYEVYWWFGAGMGIALSNVTFNLLRQTRLLVSAVGAAGDDPTGERL